MSLAKLKTFELGDLHGGIYDFEKSGDIVPKHNHDEDSAHITIVATGRLKAYSHDWEIILEPGQCADFPPEQPHEFMALEDNTRIFNITKKFQGARYTPLQYRASEHPEVKIEHLQL